MQYNDTTFASGGGIIQREEMLCSLGNGAISGDTTLLKQFTMLNNISYFEVWMAGLSVDKNNRQDDYNYNDLPDAPITMVLNQADYTIPVAVTSANVATFIRLKGIYLTVNGVRSYLTPMSTLENVTTVAGIPTNYYLNGKSIIFNCPLSQTALTTYSSVFHVEFQRVPDAFTSADTIQQAGIMETYQDLIPLKASALYLLPIDGNLSVRYDQQFYTRLELYKRDVGMMDDNRNKIIIPKLTPFI
jgi:hypothetical protein